MSHYIHFSLGFQWIKVVHRHKGLLHAGGCCKARPVESRRPDRDRFPVVLVRRSAKIRRKDMLPYDEHTGLQTRNERMCDRKSYLYASKSGIINTLMLTDNRSPIIKLHCQNSTTISVSSIYAAMLRHSPTYTRFQCLQAIFVMVEILPHSGRLSCASMMSKCTQINRECPIDIRQS